MKIELPPKRNIDGKLDYLFDDLAAAVIEAGLFYEHKAPYPNEAADTKYHIEIVTAPKLRGWNGIIGEGPTPTAAILNAILKHNGEAED